jgi:type VI secretion system protein ImpA
MDIQSLLQPISADAPCGQDLSYSIDFDHIAEMRREDDPTLEQGEWVTALKVADWPGVARRCVQLLQTRTKDLRLANWLTESWSLTEGFPGLARGIALHAALTEQYWHGIYPLPDGADQDERVGNIAWLLHRIVGLVETLPVTRSRQGPGHSLRDWQQARQSASAPPPAYGQPEATEAQRPTLDLLQRAARDTPASLWQQRLEAIRAAEAALARWQTAVDAQLGADGPGFSKARDMLASVRHDMDRLARDVGISAEGVVSVSSDDASLGEVSAPAEGSAASDSAAAQAPVQGGPPRTRAQALQRLREVAEYFRRTEPHSPVAYLADKAVKWGDMPLHEWLRQVVKDEGSMAHLQELLGLEAPSADGGH